MKTTVVPLQKAADSAGDYIAAERLILQQVQKDSFPEEIKALSPDHCLPFNIHLGFTVT